LKELGDLKFFNNLGSALLHAPMVMEWWKKSTRFKLNSIKTGFLRQKEEIQIDVERIENMLIISSLIMVLKKINSKKN
jgi:hypothetical protein